MVVKGSDKVRASDRKKELIPMKKADRRKNGHPQGGKKGIILTEGS